MAANDTITFASPTRVNTTPTSDILYTRIEDVNCTGTDFAVPPEDGQFLLAPYKTGYAGITGNVDSVALKPFWVVGGTDEVEPRGGALAMCWSGGAQRTDQQGLGYQRVPVIRGAVRFRTKLFQSNVAKTIEQEFAPGTQLTVKPIEIGDDQSAGIQGSSARLVLAAPSATSGGATAFDTSAFWAVGFVTRILNSSKVAGQAELEVQLYDYPRLITHAA